MPLVSDLATPFSSTSSTRTDSDASAAVVDSHTSASIGPLMYMSSASGAVWYFTLRTSLVLLFSKHGSGTRPSRPASHCEVLIEHRPSIGSCAMLFGASSAAGASAHRLLSPRWSGGKSGVEGRRGSVRVSL